MSEAPKETREEPKSETRVPSSEPKHAKPEEARSSKSPSEMEAEEYFKSFHHLHAHLSE